MGWRLSDAIHPVAALDRIGYILERTREPMFRVKAFRNAADAIRGLSDDELRELAASGRLRDLPGIGEKTERVIVRRSPASGRRISRISRSVTPDPDEGPGAADPGAAEGRLPHPLGLVGWREPHRCDGRGGAGSWP